MRWTGKIILLAGTAYNNQERFLEENYRELFELELDAWVSDKRVWPKQIDLKLFRQWFDVEFYALVLDFSDDQLSQVPYC